MGCWDVFCFVCGNTCRTPTYILEELNYNIKQHDELIKKNKLTNYEKKLLKYYKQSVELVKNDPKIFEKLKKLIKNSQWLEKCTMLTVNNKTIHNVKETSCNINFVDSKNNSYDQMSIATDNHENTGLFLHTDCWKFIKNKYGFDLKFRDLPYISIDDYYKVFSNIDYGKIETYYGQDFDFMKVVIEKNEYLCLSPLKNGKNIKQIKKNINNLKIRNYEERKSPSTSATFYKKGDYKLGINNKFWIVKNNKWIEIKEKPVVFKITTVQNNKFFYNIPFIGMFNNEPIFIVKTENIKKQIKYYIITLEEYREKITKKII